MLSESVRNYIVQAAVDWIMEGIEPDPDLQEVEGAEECLKNTIQEMQEFIDKYGIEKFHQTSWDVGYDY